MQLLSSVSVAVLAAGHAGAFVVPPTTSTFNGFLQPLSRSTNSHVSLSSAASASSTPQMGIAIVTGGSRGLGAAMAKELAKAGCSVAVNYASSKGPADEVVKAIEDGGGKAAAIQGDVSNTEDVERMFKEAARAFRGEEVEVLVNNAGIIKDVATLRMKPDMWQSVIDLNLSGVFYCSQTALKIMSKARKGRIVNIASIVGLIGNPGQANYSAAKAGVIGMTKTMAKEFASRGVTVNAVCPGFIESAMTEHLDQDALRKEIPLGRLGKPEEIAGMVAYLATAEAAGYITGQKFTVDGGLAMGT